VGNKASSHVTVGSGDHHVLDHQFTTEGGLSSAFVNHVVQHSLDNSAVEAFAALYETPAALAASIEEFLGRD
jgi:hypothetical protein